MSHRLQFTLTEERFKAVKAAAEREGISISAWINTAITAKLSAAPSGTNTAAAPTDK